MHRAHVLGAALVSCILEKSGVSKVVIGAAAVALLAIGLLLVTAEPWKVLWGLALSGAHLAHFPGWDPQTSIFWSPWGLSMAPWPRPSAGAASGWRAADGLRAAGCWLLASGCNGNAILGGVMGFSLQGEIWLAAALLGFASSARCGCVGALGLQLLPQMVVDSAGCPPPPWPGTDPELLLPSWDYHLERLVAQFKLPTL